MKIGYVTADWSDILDPETGHPTLGGAGWYRCGLPAKALKQNGIETVVVELISQGEDGSIVLIDWDKKHHDDCDIIVFQRWMAKKAPDVLKKAKAAGQIIVNELDDWYWGLDPRNNAWRASDPKLYPEVNRDHYWKAVAASSYLSVSTPYLKERLQAKLDIPIFVVRNCIDIPRWEFEPADNEPPVIGWVGSTTHRSGDLEILKGILGPIVEREESRFLHAGYWAGSIPAGDLAGVDQFYQDIKPIVSIVEYPKLFKGIDIGLAPLSAQPFNFAKCLDENTRVWTYKGLKKISDIEPGDLVYAPDGGLKEVVATEDQPKKTGLRITTEDGYGLSMTAEHRLLVNDEWKRADDIQLGDVIHHQRSDYSFPEYYGYWNWPADSRKTRAGDVQPLDFMDHINGPVFAVNEVWGRLLGAFAGDGSINGKTSVYIHCDGQDSDWVKQLQEDLSSIGLKSSVRAAETFGGKVLRKQYVNFSSAHFCRVLLSMGLVEERPNGKYRRIVRVPEIIFESPKGVVAAFLAGYFEADGTASRAVSATSKDLDFLRDIQGLLSLFGIISKFTVKTASSQSGFTGEYGHLSLRRAAADLFAKEIGFLSSRKTGRLDEMVAKSHSNAYRPMTYNQVVSNIELVELASVDIQVVGEQFIASGFTSHNSCIKGMEYAAAGVPFVSSSTEEYEYLRAQGVGFTAKKPGDWKKRIESLLDKDFRAEVAKENRANVEKMDINLNWEKWVKLYQQML